MAQQSHIFMSHNIDFATYPRTGMFWRGGLLHSVSGVSYGHSGRELLDTYSRMQITGVFWCLEVYDIGFLEAQDLYNRTVRDRKAEATKNTKQTYKLEVSSLLDGEPQDERPMGINGRGLGSAGPPA
jgi:hypothetical protein